MNDSRPVLDELQAALEAKGLLLRGAFHPDPQDKAPANTATLALIGNAGPAMWRVFARERQPVADPMNDWTRTVISGLADRFQATPIFPFEGPPYAPFFAWAKRAEPVHDSPIGMLIHPAYGLWHAWRGALAFRDRLPLPAKESIPSPCESCADKPCLSACPVGAFQKGRYDVAQCASHIRTEAGGDCMAEGCRARRSCPVGVDLTYEPSQARFHMEAFLRNRPRS